VTNSVRNEPNEKNEKQDFALKVISVADNSGGGKRSTFHPEPETFPV
jgi:hypothetical protein